MKNTSIWIVPSVLLLFLAAGCSKDPFRESPNGKAIRPTVSSVALTKTASGEPERTQIGAIPISEDPDNPLYILVFEQDMTERDAMVLATKGAEVTTANLSEFYMKAYAESEWHDNETGESHNAGEYFGSTKVTRPDGSTMLKRLSETSITASTRWCL